MRDERRVDVSGDSAGGGGGSASSGRESFAETVGAAFEAVHDSGPTVETSSRNIDREVAAAQFVELTADEQPTDATDSMPKTSGEPTRTSDTASTPDDPEQAASGPRKTVSSRSVDEIFDQLEEDSDPPW